MLAYRITFHAHLTACSCVRVQAILYVVNLVCSQSIVNLYRCLEFLRCYATARIKDGIYHVVNIIISIAHFIAARAVLIAESVYKYNGTEYVL